MNCCKCNNQHGYANASHEIFFYVFKFLALGDTFSINVILDVFCLLSVQQMFPSRSHFEKKKLKVLTDCSSLLHVQVIQSIAKNAADITYSYQPANKSHFS